MSLVYDLTFMGVSLARCYGNYGNELPNILLCFELILFSAMGLLAIWGSLGSRRVPGRRGRPYGRRDPDGGNREEEIWSQEDIFLYTTEEEYGQTQESPSGEE